MAVKSADNTRLFFGGMAAVGIAGLLVGGCAVDNHNPRDEVIRVESKDLGAGHKSGTKYMIFAAEGCYESRDSLVQGKWDSADVYGRLTPGKAYRVHVCGVRWPFFSMFPNVVRVHGEVAPPREKK